MTQARSGLVGIRSPAFVGRWSYERAEPIRQRVQMSVRHVLTGTEVRLAGKPVFSSAVVAGRTVYLAGHVSGRDADGRVIGRGDVEAQTIAVCEGLKRTLDAC